MLSNRKNTRLPPEHYLGQHAHFVTICCDYRKPLLQSSAAAESILALLRSSVAKHAFQLHAFCLMPDHLHALVQGTQPSCDLQEFVRIFKQCTAFAFKKTHGIPLWEKSYYDHVLRYSDVLEEVACYIWWNPVRKNLCRLPEDFPYSGSDTIEWIKRAKRTPSWSAPWKLKSPV